jgi:hypothetical protein
MNGLTGELHLIVFQRPGHVGRDVINECTTQGYIEDLMSAADGQQRFPLAEDLSDEDQFGVITFAPVACLS